MRLATLATTAILSFLPPLAHASPATAPAESAAPATQPAGQKWTVTVWPVAEGRTTGKQQPDAWIIGEGKITSNHFADRGFTAPGDYRETPPEERDHAIKRDHASTSVAAEWKANDGATLTLTATRYGPYTRIGLCIVGTLVHRTADGKETEYHVGAHPARD